MMWSAVLLVACQTALGVSCDAGWQSLETVPRELQVGSADAEGGVSRGSRGSDQEPTAHDPDEPECVLLRPEHLPELARPIRFGRTTAEEVRHRFAGEGVELTEGWDGELGGDEELVVEGLRLSTPNHGLHYGEMEFQVGAVDLDEYLVLRFRFAALEGSEPVLYSFATTTRLDHSPSVCEAPSILAESLSQQERPVSAPDLPPPGVSASRFTFYPCTEHGRPMVVTCDNGNLKVTVHRAMYPLRTVEYEMIVGE